MSHDAIGKAIERDIRDVHERFMAVMGERVMTMQLDTKERYFAVVSSLVSKLEDQNKPLRDILQEMMAEAASLIFDELGR